MYNVIEGRLAADFKVRQVAVGKEKIEKTVADGAIYVSTGGKRPDVPVHITGWEQNATDMQQYKKGDVIQFIGTAAANPYKAAGMEKEIQTMGFTVQHVDHTKKLKNKVDEQLKNMIPERQKQAEAPAAPGKDMQM